MRKKKEKEKGMNDVSDRPRQRGVVRSVGGGVVVVSGYIHRLNKSVRNDVKRRSYLKYRKKKNEVMERTRKANNFDVSSVPTRGVVRKRRKEHRGGGEAAHAARKSNVAKLLSSFVRFFVVNPRYRLLIIYVSRRRMPHPYP